MNIRFAKDVAVHLDMMRLAEDPQAGFFIGDCIGTFVIIKAFIPAPLNSEHLDRLYVNALEKFGPKLRGIYFVGREPILDDWHCQELVLVADRDRLDFYTCEAAEDGVRMEQIVNWEE